MKPNEVTEKMLVLRERIDSLEEMLCRLSHQLHYPPKFKRGDTIGDWKVNEVELEQEIDRWGCKLYMFWWDYTLINCKDNVIKTISERELIKLKDGQDKR